MSEGRGGFSGTFLASKVTQVAVVSSWNGSYQSMGLTRHVRYLALVMKAMRSPQCIRNVGLRRSFLAENLNVRRGVQWPLLAYIATQMAVSSGWNGSYGSMGPKGHIRRLYLYLVMGVMPGPQWVPNNRLRGSFSA